MEDQADLAVNAMAENIADMIDNTSPTDSATSRPEPPDDEAPAEQVVEETPPEPVKAVEKRKIKWQGQEVEIEPERETELLQKGFDYTQKTQELSKRLTEIAPLEGLAKQIQSDPNLAQHIAGYFQQTVEKKEAPVLDDPLDEFAYKIKQETLKEVSEKLIAPLQEQAKQMTHQQVIARTHAQVASDPLYGEVQSAMVDYIKSLPPSLQRTTYLQLDQDPKAYIESYEHFRKQIETKKSTTVDMPPVKREERAPILENAGKAAESTGNAKQSEKIAKLKKNALRDGDPKALADWLQQSGAINHLF